MTIMGKCREVLAAHGVKFVPAVMVLLAMSEYGMNYDAALAACADFKGIAPEIVHGSICYCMLAAGVETPAPAWFALLVDEMEEDYERELMEDENGISAE